MHSKKYVCKLFQMTVAAYENERLAKRVVNVTVSNGSQ